MFADVILALGTTLFVTIVLFVNEKKIQDWADRKRK